MICPIQTSMKLRFLSTAPNPLLTAAGSVGNIRSIGVSDCVIGVKNDLTLLSYQLRAMKIEYRLLSHKLRVIGYRLRIISYEP